MGRFNGLPTYTRVEAPSVTYEHGIKDKINCPNSYASIIGMMLYLE